MPSSGTSSTGGAISVRAPAKINLTLDVLGLRPDGCHEVATVYQTLTLADRLDVRLSWVPDDGPTIVVSADDPEVPAGPANLVYRAVEAVLRRAGSLNGAVASGLSPRVEVAIAKAIPVAAGLGGGSSDAAAALTAVNGLLGGRVAPAALAGLAAALGSDVPFFLRGGTALARGRGEDVEPLADAPPFHVVLVKAGRKESTAGVYARHDRMAPGGGGRRDRSRAAALAIRGGDPTALAASIGNDLAAAARELAPEIARVESALVATGAEAVAVSGAGPTVFALYRGAEQAASAERLMASLFPWTALAEFASPAGDR